MRAAFLWSFLLAAAAIAGPPNIVLIVADDLGYGDLGAYGSPSIRTPHLDRMAAEGMLFTQFYSASPVCSPSRAALLTGRLPVRYGMNAVLPPVTLRGLPPEELSLAELLQGEGYATACIGKWHLGRLDKYLPTSNGFDYYFGLPYSNDMSPTTNTGIFYRLKLTPPLPLLRGTEVIEREPNQAELTRRYTDEAIGFIESAAAKEQPFFLYLPHTAPHIPLAASDAFRGKSAGGLYGDVVEELDWSTGQILATLRKLGIDADTLVMFTSDNGPWLAKGTHGGSPGPFREGKGSTWEGGVRVPLVARWPGRIPAGVRTRAFSTMMDLFPTIASLSGAKIPDDRPYDGESISKVLLSNDPGREALFYYWVRHELRAVRKGPWKLHRITNNPRNGARTATRNASPLLYDVNRDPGERYNAAPEHPEIVSELTSLMESHRRRIGVELLPD